MVAGSNADSHGATASAKASISLIDRLGVAVVVTSSLDHEGVTLIAG
jgi:hypothetical protein